MQDEELILLEDMPSIQTKLAAVFIGRCSPPTAGHYKVINQMANVIRTYNKEHEGSPLETTPVIAIVVGKNTSKDKSRNPLSYDDIVKVMKAAGQIDNKAIFIKAESAFDALVKCREKGYEPILVFGGSDRGNDKGSPYKDILDNYFVTKNNKKIKHEFISTERNNAADLGNEAQETLLHMIEKDGEVDVSEVSGTLARKAVAMGLHRAFAVITGLSGKKEIADIVFNKVKRGLAK